MKFKTHSHRTHSLTLDDGSEVELQHEPYYENDILAERIGDKLVVAYLVHDDDGYSCNPMDNHAQGNFYTMPTRYGGGGSITDDASEIYYALGVGNYGEVDIDRLFACEPYIGWGGTEIRHTCLRDMAALEFLDKISQDLDLIDKWLEARDLEMDDGETYEQAFNERRDEIWRDLEDCNGAFCDEVEARAIALYPEFWQQIAGPFVVICDYCANNHGPGTASMSTTTWDGDPDDLPTAIWVADKDCIENITPYPDGVSMKQVQPHPDSVYGVFKDDVEIFRGKWEDCRVWIKEGFPPTGDDELRTAAAKYAEGICSEYAAWCNGDVYGCVSETFSAVVDGDEDDEPKWEQLEEDACWGFIGRDYALETLKSEYFDHVVKRLKAEPSVPASADSEGGTCD